MLSDNRFVNFHVHSSIVSVAQFSFSNVVPQCTHFDRTHAMSSDQASETDLIRRLMRPAAIGRKRHNLRQSLCREAMRSLCRGDALRSKRAITLSGSHAIALSGRESDQPRRFVSGPREERPAKAPRRSSWGSWKPWVPVLPADLAEQEYQDNLIQEMYQLKRDPEHWRRHWFRTQCDYWDPDKNSGSTLSILMFQTLEAKEKWFFSDN